RSSSSVLLAVSRPPPLSLHDALPSYFTLTPGDISENVRVLRNAMFRIYPYEGQIAPGPDDTYVPELAFVRVDPEHGVPQHPHVLDRKSTRLNSSHGSTSYAVFCLKTK